MTLNYCVFRDSLYPYEEETGLLYKPIYLPEEDNWKIYASKQHRLEAQKKRYMERKQLKMQMTSLAGLGCVPSVSSIDRCMEQSSCQAVLCTAPQAKLAELKEDSNMNTVINTAATKDYSSERRHLSDFVYDAKNRKVQELRKHFNIDCVDTYELTPEEYVKAIQDGKFKYRDEGKHSKVPHFYGHPMNGICLCDPDKEPDHTSYQKVLKMLEKDEEAIMLKVRVLEPEKALPLVEKFEERKYH